MVDLFHLIGFFTAEKPGKRIFFALIHYPHLNCILVMKPKIEKMGKKKPS
jgi:hypothetical protein